MTQIYHGLLRKLAAEPGRVLRERVSLSLFTKLMIGWRSHPGGLVRRDHAEPRPPISRPGATPLPMSVAKRRILRLRCAAPRRSAEEPQ